MKRCPNCGKKLYRRKVFLGALACKNSDCENYFKKNSGVLFFETEEMKEDAENQIDFRILPENKGGDQ